MRSNTVSKSLQIKNSPASTPVTQANLTFHERLPLSNRSKLLMSNMSGNFEISPAFASVKLAILKIIQHLPLANRFKLLMSNMSLKLRISPAFAPV